MSNNFIDRLLKLSFPSFFYRTRKIKEFSNMAYQIKKVLGEGGMGIVYQAVDTSLNRIVAIKSFREKVVPTAKAIKRFMRETEISASLDHPNIIKVYQFLSENNRSSLIMEYIEGEPLLDYIENQKPSLDKILEIFEKVVEAVHYAHRKQIIHRDIKPSNIMVRKNGEPVLMDFGIAKASQVEDLTRSGELVGTPQYMSPEQASGSRREIDFRTDIYSLGAILYQILTKARPVEGENLTEILYNIYAKPVILPRERNPEISVDLEQICMKALCKEKDQRYATAKAFAEDLRNYREGKKIKASGFIQKQKWQKRFIIIGIVFLVMLAGIGIWSSYRNIQKSENEKKYQLQAIASLEKKVEDAWKNAEECYAKQQFAKAYSYLEEFSTYIISDKKFFLERKNNLQPKLEKFLYETYALSQIYALEKSNERLLYLVQFQETCKQIEESSSQYTKHWVVKEKGKSILTEDYFYEAKKNYNSRQFSTAIEKFENLRTHYSSFESIYPIQKLLQQYANIVNTYQLGLCYFQQKKFKTAFEHFSNAKEKLEQSNFFAFVREQQEILQQVKKMEQNFSIEKFYSNMLIYLASSRIGEIPYSENIFFKDSKSNEKEYDPDLIKYITNILDLLEQKRYSEVLSHYSEEWALLQELKARLLIWKNSGEREKNIRNSIFLMEECLKENPIRDSCYLILGSAYLELKEYERSLNSFEYAFQINPQQVESISKFVEILPNYQSLKYNDMENIIGVFLRWWLRINMTIVDIHEEDIIRIRSNFRKKWQEQENSTALVKDAEIIYPHLFSVESLAQLAQTSFLGMRPCSQALQFLEAKRKSIEEELKKPETTNLESLKNKHKIVSKIIGEVEQENAQNYSSQTLYLLSSIPYQNRIPENIVAEFTNLEKPEYLRTIYNLVFKKDFRNNCESEEDWQKLYYLGARLLAHTHITIPQFLQKEIEVVPSSPFSKKYFRTLLIDLSKREIQEPLKIILLKALQEVGYFDTDNNYFIWQVARDIKKYNNNPFIEMIISSLIPFDNKDNTKKQWFEFFSQCSPLTRLWIVHTTEDFDDIVYYGDREKFFNVIDSTWDKGFYCTEDYRQQMLSIILTDKIGHLQRKVPNPKPIFHRMKKFFQHENAILQKAALALFTESDTLRKDIHKDFTNTCKIILDSDAKWEIKLMAKTALIRMADSQTLKAIQEKETTNFEKIAFLYGLYGQEKELLDYLDGILAICKTFLENPSAEGQGIIQGMLSHFYPFLQNLLVEIAHRSLIRNFFEKSLEKCIYSQYPDSLYWALIATSKSDHISKIVWKKIAKDLLEKPNDGNILGSLLNIAAKNPNDPELKKEAIQWHKILEEKLKEPKKNKKQLMSVLWFYRELLRSHQFSDKQSFNLIMQSENYISIDEYIIRSLENCHLDPNMQERAQKSLETIIKISTAIESIKGDFYERRYFLRSMKQLCKIYEQKKEFKNIWAILEKENLHNIEIEIAHLWLKLKIVYEPNDHQIENFWKNWKEKEISDCRTESLRLQMQAMLERQNKQYKEALQHLKYAYMLCPEDSEIQTNMIEIYLYDISDLNMAEKLLPIAITKSDYKNSLRWLYAQYYAMKREYDVVEDILAKLAFPLRIDDVQRLNIPKEKLGIIYSTIAKKYIDDYNYYNVTYWLDKAYQEGYRVHKKTSKKLEKNARAISIKYPKFREVWNKIYIDKK